MKLPISRNMNSDFLRYPQGEPLFVRCPDPTSPPKKSPRPSQNWICYQSNPKVWIFVSISGYTISLALSSRPSSESCTSGEPYVFNQDPYDNWCRSAAARCAWRPLIVGKGEEFDCSTRRVTSSFESPSHRDFHIDCFGFSKPVGDRTRISHCATRHVCTGGAQYHH